MVKRYQVQKDPDPFPRGTYRGRLIDTEEREGSYGTYLMWNFDVFNGSEALVASGMTGARFGTRSKEVKFVAALLGRSLANGEEFTLEELYGQPCQVELELKQLKNGLVNYVVDISPAERSADADDADDVPF
jgi:hypothetical protein